MHEARISAKMKTAPRVTEGPRGYRFLTRATKAAIVRASIKAANHVILLIENLLSRRRRRALMLASLLWRRFSERVSVLSPSPLALFRDLRVTLQGKI